MEPSGSCQARWLGELPLSLEKGLCLSQGTGLPGDMKLHMANQASSRHQCSPPRAFGAVAWSACHGSNTHLSLAPWQQSRGPPWAWTRHCGPPAPPTARPGELALDSKVGKRQEKGREEEAGREEGRDYSMLQEMQLQRGPQAPGQGVREQPSSTPLPQENLALPRQQTHQCPG